MANELDPDILFQIRAILRRDLKLASDAPLALDMPFFGSDIDLDSLDMLLLVTSIERQFAVRIPNEAVGKVVFADVASLTRYVQDHGGKAKDSSADHLSKLPHGAAFRFISRVLEVRPGESARGIWATDGKEPFFAGHFPGNPVVPGVLIAEALAQICGLAGPADSPPQGKIAHVDLRFERSASPPVEIELNCKVVRIIGPLQMCDVTAKAGDRLLAQGSITLHRGSGKND